MYRLFLTNFNYFHQRECEDLKEACKLAKQIGFEIAIYGDGEIVGTYSPISGFKYWDDDINM